LLFVPGDSEKKLEKAAATSADALILDLEDAVAPSRKDAARAMISSVITAGTRSWKCFVRINPLDSGFTLEDLAAVVKPGLDGVVLPKANGAQDVIRLGNYLDALETKARMPEGSVKVLVVATETPAAMFALSSYAPAHPRLAALTWGAEDLSAAIGARSNKSESGAWTEPYQIARAQCLFAASAAGVAPIDTLYADFRDTEGLARSCAIARRDGFTGRVAIHPAQVDAINTSFTPSAQELAHARRVVEAFAASPDTGVVGIDGQMYDMPHLKAAQRTLSAAE
jgi:citrate lyase subunit beta/citryl-CoA lyase